MSARRVTHSSVLTVISAAAVVTLLSASSAAAAQAPVGLGAATAFAVLAGSGVTNTGPTTITGDIGTFPTASETGLASITLHGANHRGDAVTRQAKSDLTTAYGNAAGREPVNHLPVELGGRTLLPGVYASGTFGLTGTLTLNAKGDANAQFVFQAASTLTTASRSVVRLVNGAQACNVVWQVGSSATFGTGTRFIGDVLSLTSITATTGASFHGRLLARNGAVTLDTNTITRATCAVPTPSTGGGGATTLTPSAATSHHPGTTVTVASPTSPVAPKLPFTGLPVGALAGRAGALIVLGGLTLVATSRHGKERSGARRSATFRA
ncbi:MAG: hypothetical protein QOD07_2137 [Frankiaceae bacterium]|jgi:hypothetical protein|nr:hypothetical protein [Frankiaceae bacterium]